MDGRAGIMWWAEGTGLPRWTGTLVLPALLARFRMNDREEYCLHLVCTYVCARNMKVVIRICIDCNIAGAA